MIKSCPDTRLVNKGVNEKREFDDRKNNGATVKADGYRDDLPQCGYYCRTAGKIFLSYAFEENEIYIPSLPLPSFLAKLATHSS